MIFTCEPFNQRTDISYLDSFSDGVNRNTFAYPTKVTDPDGRVAATPFSSTVQYDYLRGWVTRTETPKRGQDPSGIITTYAYDVAGRIVRLTNGINGAYTRYVYQPNRYYVVSNTTLNDLATEYYAVTVYDGADRVRAVASDHPTASDPATCTPQVQSGWGYQSRALSVSKNMNMESFSSQNRSSKSGEPISKLRRLDESWLITAALSPAISTRRLEHKERYHSPGFFRFTPLAHRLRGRRLSGSRTHTLRRLRRRAPPQMQACASQSTDGHRPLGYFLL